MQPAADLSRNADWASERFSALHASTRSDADKGPLLDKSRQAAQAFRKLTQQHDTAVEASRALQAQVEHVQRLADDRALALSAAREELVSQQSAAEQHLRQREAEWQQAKEEERLARAAELATVQKENAELLLDRTESQQRLAIAQQELATTQKQLAEREEARVVLKRELDAAAGEILDLNMKREEASCAHRQSVDKLKGELRAQYDEALCLARHAAEERIRGLEATLHQAQGHVRALEDRCCLLEQQHSQRKQDAERQHQEAEAELRNEVEAEKKAHRRSCDALGRLEGEIAELRQALETQTIATQDARALCQQLQQQVAIQEEEARIGNDRLGDVNAALRCAQRALYPS
jgi:chromosome segregation ATPase